MLREILRSMSQIVISINFFVSALTTRSLPGDGLNAQMSPWNMEIHQSPQWKWLVDLVAIRVTISIPYFLRRIGYVSCFVTLSRINLSLPQKAAEAKWKRQQCGRQFWQMHEMLFTYQHALNNGYLVEALGSFRPDQLLQDLSKRRQYWSC